MVYLKVLFLGRYFWFIYEWFIKDFFTVTPIMFADDKN